MINEHIDTLLFLLMQHFFCWNSSWYRFHFLRIDDMQRTFFCLNEFIKLAILTLYYILVSRFQRCHWPFHKKAMLLPLCKFAPKRSNLKGVNGQHFFINFDWSHKKMDQTNFNTCVATCNGYWIIQKKNVKSLKFPEYFHEVQKIRWIHSFLLIFFDTLIKKKAYYTK